MNWFTRLLTREPLKLPPDLSDRLQRFGVDIEQFAREFRREGLSFAERYVEDLEEGENLFNQWFPRLKKHERDCQEKRQYPQLDSLSKADQAKYDLYVKAIEELERLPCSNPCKTRIFTLPLLGQLAAATLWPSQVENSVLLTREEHDAWDKIYHHPEESFWWFIYHWCNVDSPRDERLCARIEKEFTLEDGCEWWVVTTGLLWGPLFGGERGELWSWNGHTAKYVGVCDGWDT